MRRREFIALLGAAAGLPSAARAQRSASLRRVGVLLTLAEGDPEAQARVAAFRQELANLGWIDGQNLHLEFRWAGADPKLAQQYAAELVALKPSVIFAAPTSSARTLKLETDSVPVVFAQVVDPVGAGLVESLAHPGANITGFAHFEFPIAAKWLEILKQIATNVTRVAVLYDPANSASTGYLPAMETAATPLSTRLLVTPVRDSRAIEEAIGSLAREPNGGVVLLPGPIMGPQSKFIIDLCNQHRLPSIYAFRYHPEGGGLASYGVDLKELFRDAASYVDRILKGEKPANLPVQQPTRYELVINLKTAKQLGLSIPVALLASADEIIE